MLARTPRRCSSLLSPSGTRRRAKISLPQPLRLPVATQKTAHLLTETRRPVLDVRPPCQQREEPMTIPCCHEVQYQAVPPSRWSWKMRQRVRSSAPMARDASTRSLGGAAPASGTGKGSPHGRIGPPPPGHRADAEERPRRPPAKLGAPRTGWRGSRQTSGLACQTPASSLRTPWRRTAVGDMNTLTCSCLRKILHCSQAFF